jgi:hypothetical protein
VVRLHAVRARRELDQVARRSQSRTSWTSTPPPGRRTTAPGGELSTVRRGGTVAHAPPVPTTPSADAVPGR